LKRIKFEPINLGLDELKIDGEQQYKVAEKLYNNRTNATISIHMHTHLNYFPQEVVVEPLESAGKLSSRPRVILNEKQILLCQLQVIVQVGVQLVQVEAHTHFLLQGMKIGV